jgi:WhiB family redox-sensing transcriptional regulator
MGIDPDHEPIDRLINRSARCADPHSSLTALFFSERPPDIARAKAICSRCVVRDLCLLRALERHEPVGVWGGESLRDGKIVTGRRGRGRSPKNPGPAIVDEIIGRHASRDLTCPLA